MRGTGEGHNMVIVINRIALIEIMSFYKVIFKENL